MLLSILDTISLGDGLPGFEATQYFNVAFLNLNFLKEFLEIASSNIRWDVQDTRCIVPLNCWFRQFRNLNGGTPVTPKSPKCQDVYKECFLLTSPDIYEKSPVRLESGGSVPRSPLSTCPLSCVEWVWSFQHWLGWVALCHPLHLVHNFLCG